MSRFFPQPWFALAFSLVAACSPLFVRPLRASNNEDPSTGVFVSGRIVDAAGQPVQGAIVKSESGETSALVTTDQAGNFRIAVAPTAAGSIYAALTAQTSDNQLASRTVFQENGKLEPVELVVKPGRQMKVLVQDAEGAPVAGAEVGFLGQMRRLASGISDSQGCWRAVVPAEVPAWAVYARKSAVGFDYATADRGRGSLATAHPLPEQVTLKLDGAQTIKVRTVDAEDRPLADVRVGLWYAKKPGYEADINLSGLSDRWARSDKDGVVMLDWLPAKVDRSWAIMYRAENHSAADHAFFVPADKPVEELTIRLLPLAELSGRVTYADGRPAAQLLVRAEGQGAGQNRFRQAARTDADGRYKFRAYSEQAYVIVAGDRAWAAPYRAGVVLRAGKPVANIDFVLAPATRVHGRVTIGEPDRPASKTSISAVINKGQIPEELRRPGDRIYHAVQMYFSGQTDADGRYEFFLGPGDYDLQGPPRTERIKLSIPAAGAPAEIVHDFKMPRAETGPLTIRVVDRNKQPLSGALVSGQYATSQARRLFQANKTDDAGVLKVERSLDPLVLHAQSPDKRFAGVARLPAESPEVEMVVAEVASATGRLTDAQGQPLADKELNYGILIYQGEPLRSPFTTSFGGRLVTDADGKFELSGLVPRERYDVSLKIDDHSSRRVANVTPASPSLTDLGTIKADPNPIKPYVPPTPAERTAQAFSTKDKPTPRNRLDNVLAAARREYTRPLLLLGTLSDPACVDLFRLFEERTAQQASQQKLPSPAEMRWEFELLALDAAQPDVVALARDLGIPLSADVSPLLAVLSADGRLTETYPLRLENGTLNKLLLAEFMHRHKLATRDAEQNVAAALRAAAAEKKRAFLILSASWCGPCRMLAAFLEPFKSELERHYVFVKLDVSRDEHADQIRERYKESKTGGVPWFAILDPQGAVLVTSNAPALETEGGNSNIGYPSEPKAIEHFLAMLRQTAPELPAEALNRLRAALEKSP